MDGYMPENAKGLQVCFLCFQCSEKSGSGMDVYAWNIISRAPANIKFETVCHNRKNTLDWVLKEFILPIDELNLSKVNTDIYHAVSPVATKIAFLTRKRPIITTVHDMIPNSLPAKPWYYLYNSKKRRWLNPWYWWFLKRSDHFIASSESTKRDLIRILKVPSEKVSVVHYGTDHSGLRLTPRTSYHDPKVVLYIGALDPGKGVCDLVQAFAIVAKRLEDVKLVIGGRGKAQKTLIKMVKDLQLEDKVEFLGFVPQEKLSDYYDAADVFVFPSYLGFHLMLLDAMARGLPVIADNNLDAPEYVGDGGWLVESGNITQIAESIITALSDEDNYVLMSKRAIERVKTFSWEKMAKETINVYNEYLSQKIKL
jgi:glycosyltransferase involved in cell wall biosynthesis